MSEAQEWYSKVCRLYAVCAVIGLTTGAIVSYWFGSIVPFLISFGILGVIHAYVDG